MMNDLDTSRRFNQRLRRYHHDHDTLVVVVIFTVMIFIVPSHLYAKANVIMWRC